MLVVFHVNVIVCQISIYYIFIMSFFIKKLLHMVHKHRSNYVKC
jgi:hypothetical protein